MKHISHFRALWLVLVLLLGAAAQTTPNTSVPAPAGIATIAEAKGSVTIRSPQGALLGSEIGRALAPETIIETGKGSLVLELQDGSQLFVDSHSRVVLKQPQQEGHFFDLLLGKIMAQVQKRFGKSPSFKMGTPTAVIAVRGTRFLVDFNGRRTTVKVYEGLVEVAGTGGAGTSILLRPGYFTRVEEDESPQAPREFSDGSGGAGAALRGGDRGAVTPAKQAAPEDPMLQQPDLVPGPTAPAAGQSQIQQELDYAMKMLELVD